MQLPFPTTLSEIAVWLLSAGAAGLIVSLLMERVSVFKQWRSPLKKWCVIALFIGLPYVGLALKWALSVIDPVIVSKVQEYLNLAIYGLAMWASSQYAHDKDPAAKDKELAVGKKPN